MKFITKKDLKPFSEIFRRSRAELLEQLKAQERRTAVQRQYRAHERAAWSKMLKDGHAPVKQILGLCKEQKRQVIEFRDATMRDLLTIPPEVAAAWDGHIAAIDAGLLLMQSEPPTPRDPNVFYLMPEVTPAIGGACGVIRGEPSGTLHPYQAAVGSGWGWDGDDEQYNSSNCRVEFGIPWEYFPPSSGVVLWNLSCAVLLDIHGAYSVNSDDGWSTSKQASADLSLRLSIRQVGDQYSRPWEGSQQSLVSVSGDNIGTNGRVDFTGYKIFDTGWAVPGEASLQIAVDVMTSAYARGGGAQTVMDLRNGGGRATVKLVVVTFKPYPPG